ncbi:tetratricopeptide repeat protein [Candidatus Leptofilum sp.]|uniref:tetratricopeptide repeat protein n=1 Tax=Candidatus Leptofilum sp. TaxID=3241576 RepID=UPI003B5B87C4
MPTSRANDSPLVTGTQLRQLAAYIPATLADRIMRHGLPTPGEPRSLMAATLFSDISGFTRMSEELASDGPRGAEELNRVLLVTFTAMIDVIHELGGAVNHFYGDAMSVYFPDTDGTAAQRALVCAQMMQQLMLTSFNRVVTNRPPGKHPFFELTIKIGVGYGRCQELVVGDPQQSLEFVLTGEAVDEAAMAEHQASSGDIIASAAVMIQAGLLANKDYQKMDTAVPQPETQPILHWDSYDDAAQQRLAKVILPFVPPALFRRLVATGATEMAEHRPVTTIFVQFDYKNRQETTSDIETADMGQQLQKYYEWASGVVSRFGQENARVNRVLTGDKGNQLHIMFGAPVAPDAPEQALRCLLALQREKPSFISAQRIGVAVGKVFAGPVGSSARREYTVVGDVVNLSARLMQVCEPGTILTDQIMAERTQQVIEFESLPPMHLKGKQTAVTPHLVQRDRAATTLMNAYVDRWERPLVGRENELDLLLGGMDAALRGVGGATAVYGGTGVGKSRLLAAGVRHWLSNGGLGLIGVCYPHTNDTPYSPWRDVWREYFGLTDGQSIDQQVSAVTTRTIALLPDANEDVGLWRELLGLPIPQSDALTDLTAEARQVRLFSLVRNCVQAIAAQQPVLIILEGLQWADQATLALLDDLGGHLEELAVFLATTFRAREDLALALLERPSCIAIPLVDLSPASARQLLAQLVGASELPQPVEQHLGMRDREGRDSPVNPLFMEEALKVMMGAGVLQVNGRVQVNEAKLAKMQVPDTIHGLLLARLDRLPPAGRDLLQVASIIGRQFAVEPLQVIAKSPTEQIILNLLAKLTESEMTRLISAAPEWIYLFQHAMTHEVAYESLPYARRQKLHAAVANWLADKYAQNLKPLHPMLAYHHSRAANHKQALHYAILAADEARNIFANREAIDLYNLAETHLTALDDDELWETAVHLCLSRGNVLILLGDLATAFADAEKALDLAQENGDEGSTAVAYNLMAEIRYRQGAFDEVQTLTKKIFIDLSKAAGNDQLARAYIWAGWSASSKLNYATALDYLEKAKLICQQENNNHLLARVYEAISFTRYSQKELELSLDAMQEGVKLSREFSTPINIGIALSNVGFVQFTLGQYQEAVSTFNEAVQIGQESGKNLYALAMTNRAAAYSRLGDFEAALVDFESAVNLLTSMNYPSLLVEALLFWGFEYFSPLQKWTDAKRRFEEAQQLINSQPESYIEEKARLLVGLGEIEIRSGSLNSAEDLLEKSYQLIEHKELIWWKPITEYFLGVLYRKMGREAEAWEYLQKSLASSKDGNPDFNALVLLEMAKLESNPEERDKLLESCILSAKKRSRYADKVVCLKLAAQMLLESEDVRSKNIGKDCLASLGSYAIQKASR